MVGAFPKATRLHEDAETVGSATVKSIPAAGFDVISDPTKKFPNLARVIHPEGADGFTAENLDALEKCFTNTHLGS